jgi:hypothetical protein
VSWWDLGENVGFSGNKLALHRIMCAFCEHEGNFSIQHHVERKHAAQNRKVLNYDTLTCGNCGNLTMVFWSALGIGHGMHDFRAVPWPQKTVRHPDHWPEDVGRYWLQAKRSLEEKNWDAAALMARGAVQLIARYQEATGKNLKEEIDWLADKGLLPPIMKEWSHEVRLLGNENAHPRPGEKGTEQRDARDIVEFLTFLLTMVYDLPDQIGKYRGRKK